MSTEATLDSRFAALPRLIRDAANPNPTAANIGRFMEELLQADPVLFDGALEFLSREGHGFVLLRNTGGPIQDARTWPRWPLKRLFATRRPSLITNPTTGQRALAVPFNVRGERRVVVAPIGADALSVSQQTFLDALQSVCVQPAVSSPANERVPRFVWLGKNGALADRIEAVLQRRGWSVLSVPTFGHVLLMLEQDQADVALLEAAGLNGELSSLRAVRHAAKIGDAPIVYFTAAECGAEIQTLVDFVLSPDASESDVLHAMKMSVALVSRMRTQALHSNVECMEQHLRSCADFPQLAQTCAEAALLLGADAVSVMLADEAGGVHAAHVPFQNVLGDHWPTPFVTGESVTQTRLDDAFFDAAFDDADYARRVRALPAISAAALPISNGAHIVGSLLAFSTRQPMFQPEFDALTELCERTGHVASTLRHQRTGQQPWQYAIVNDAMVEAFAGRRSRASVHVGVDDEGIAIVMLEREDDRRAVAVAQRLLAERETELRELAGTFKEDARGILLALVEGDRLRFACDGLPVPLRVPLSGPVPASRIAQSCETGTIGLDAQSVTLLYCSDFAAQIATGDLVGAVQRGLRWSRATLARSIPRLGVSAHKLAFACVTMLSSDVDSPHLPALV